MPETVLTESHTTLPFISTIFISQLYNECHCTYNSQFPIVIFVFTICFMLCNTDTDIPCLVTWKHREMCHVTGASVLDLKCETRTIRSLDTICSLRKCRRPACTVGIIIHKSNWRVSVRTRNITNCTAGDTENLDASARDPTNYFTEEVIATSLGNKCDVDVKLLFKTSSVINLHTFTGKLTHVSLFSSSESDIHVHLSSAVGTAVVCCSFCFPIHY